MKYFAHSTDDNSKKDWEPLETHLENVARTAMNNASKFDAGDFGWLIGAYHDLGKAKPEFLKRLEGSGPKVQHTLEGAQTIIQNYHNLGHVMAPLITGHHTGLANGKEFPEKGGGTPYVERMREIESKSIIPSMIDESQIQTEKMEKFLTKLVCDKESNEIDSFKLQFFMRMLFSCLVDADFIETENFYQNVNRGSEVSLVELKNRFGAHMDGLTIDNSKINNLRSEILESVRNHGKNDAQGMFTLTVPTGGGKTLSSMAFALEHAIENNMDRIIYVIPFTSIVEQNADVFRKVFKIENAILEHHSTFDTESLKGYQVDDRKRACENWDRPIVVTTAVQFFESLFANKTSRCRKLHNISNSVIILDEAQTIPLQLLRPCLAALKAIVEGYKSSVVLCTATQPAVLKNYGSIAKSIISEALPEAGTAPGQTMEIAPNPEMLYEEMKRVSVKKLGYLDDSDLSKKLKGHEQVLCVVNNREQAKNMFDMIDCKVGNSFHLTTNMCANHRRTKLAEIRKKLDNKEPVRVISTSLIEAGVDIDFPCAYRSIAGLDSIAQVAGRCNREMKMNRNGKLGQIYVFEPDEKYNIPSEIRSFVQCTESVFKKHEDVLSLVAIEEYYNNLIWTRGNSEMDNYDVAGHNGFMEAIKKSMGKTLNGFAFADIGNCFKLIRNDTVPIIIPSDSSSYGIKMEHIEDIRGNFPQIGRFIRIAQQHSVQVPKRILQKMFQLGFIEEIAAEHMKTGTKALFHILCSDSASKLYSDETGLNYYDLKNANMEPIIV